MKKLLLPRFTSQNCLLAWLVALPSFLQAQIIPAAPSNAPPTQTYAQQMEYVLEPLDKSQVTTGILYDAVFSASGLDEYTSTNNTLTTNSMHFFQAYWEMYYATFQRGTMVAPEQLENQMETFHSDPAHHHPLGIMQYQFNELREDAVDANLIREQDGRLYDVAGRPSSPYTSVTGFLVSPLVPDTTKLYSGRHYFYIDSRFILSNTGLGINSIQSVAINYNGTVTSQGTGTPLQVDLLPGGQGQTMRVTVTLTNGSVNIVDYVLPDIEPSYGGGNISTCDGMTRITVQGDSFDGGYGTGGYSAKGTAYIYFANQNCSSKTIRKPIVFLDGIDPGNSRSHTEIYNENINKPFFENGDFTQLGDELRRNGYDIIIFDYDGEGKEYDRGGGAHIENNARAVAKMLTTLYSTYQSTIEEDFVVIGPSMGSIVGQYALAYMEKNNIPHHTRLYISFDGPHQGANISIGLQSFIDQMTFHSAIWKINEVSFKMHNSAAARQLIVDHSANSSEVPEPNIYRTIFLQNLAQVGTYPQLCRMVAVVNGSGNGTHNTHFDPCDKLIQVGIKKRFRSSSCTSNNCYKMKADLFASTASNRCLTTAFFAFGSIYGGLLYSPPIFFRFTQPHTFNTSYDEAPGSGFQEKSLGDLVPKAYKNLAYIFSGKLEINDDRLNFDTFMPSVSAADFRPPSGDVNIYTNLSQYDLTKCSGRTPFDKVYIGTENTPHVSINAEKANWFREEVYNQRGPSQCQTACSNPPNAPTLSATANPINANQPTTLTASGCGGTVNWNTPNGSPNVSPAVTTTYTATCTVNGCTSSEGSVTITVNGTPPVGSCSASNDQCSGNQYEVRNYTVNVSSSGTYTLRVTYRSHEGNGVIRWSVNGGGVQTKNVSQTGIDPYQEVDLGSASLTAGSNTISLSSGQLFQCFRKVCANGGGGVDPCSNPPGAPSLSATVNPISANQPTTLTASGCGGTVNWNTPNGSPNVAPAVTTTYTATCTVNGCTSSSGSVTITVNGTPPVGSCSASNDQCSGNAAEVRNYTVNVSSSGTYTLRVTYRSHEGNGAIRWSVNGGGAQTTNVSQTGIDPYQEVDLGSASLNAGSNTISLSSGQLFQCFRKVCANGGGVVDPCPNPPNAPTLSATTNPINVGQSTTLTASGCGGTVNWNTPGGNPTVSPSSTTTYTATCTVNGCTSGNGSVTITVNGTPPVGSCSASNDQCSGNSAEVRNYTVSVPSSGTYTLRVTYRSHEGNGAIRWSVNGGGVQTKNVNQTGIDPYQEVDLGSASLNAGSNTISLSSGSLFVCFRKVCANGGGARLGVAEEPATDSPELMVSPNPNDGEFVASFYVEPGRKATLRVSDIQGREVWKKNLTGQGDHSEPVRLPAQSIGAFVLLLDKEATGSKGQVEFKRVIVVK